MDSYHRAAHPNDPRVKSSGRRSRSRSPRKGRYNRRSRSKSPDRSYNRSRHSSRSKRHDSRERRRGASPPNEHILDNPAAYGTYDASVDPSYNNVWPQDPYSQVYAQGFGYAAPPPPPIINNAVSISQPVPPGSTDFAPPAPMWNAPPDMSMVGGVPPPPTLVMEDEESRKKKDAAIAEEKRNQRLALEKQRDDCKQRATALSRELDMLRNQRKDLTSSSKRSPSPTTMNFIRENDKLQAAIQEKLSTIKNVIEMLSDIIGKDTTKSGEKTSSSDKPKKESSNKEDKKSRKDEKSPVKSREKTKVKEIKESNGVFNVVHYDPELHWCQLCNVFPKTAKDFLNHLHSVEHQAKQMPDQPWRENLASDDFPSHPDAPAKRTPIRGLQFFVPATAWFCKLCEVWIGDLHCASIHLKSKKHALEFGKILQKAPNFEIDWATERQRALDKSEPHVQLQLTSVSGGNSFLDSIPLQIKNKKPETNNTVQNLMEKVMKNIEPKRKSPESKTQSSGKKKHKKDDTKENKKKKRKRKHSSSSSSSDSSSSSSSDSSSSSSSSSSSDDSDNENKKKLDPIAIVRKLQSEAIAKRENDISTHGGWTSVPQNAIATKRLTKPKSPPPERPKVNIPGPKIIEFTDKTREKKSENSSTRSRDTNDSRNSRNDTKSRTTPRRPRTPEKRDRDKDRTKTTIKIDPSKSSKNAPTPLEKSREARSRETSDRKRSDSKKESAKEDDKKKQMNKKLPFIGRMPVFKKQQAMEKEEQKNKEEAQCYEMDMSNDCDDLMPDPMQYAFLNAPPPPPPPQVYQIPLEIIAPQQSYPTIDDSEEVLPPGITQEEHDSVPQTISEDPRKGPLPNDFQEALNIIFDGAKPPSPIPVPEPPEEVEPQYVV